jgi:hypothetical protein
MPSIKPETDCVPTYTLTGVTQVQAQKLLSLLNAFNDAHLDELFYVIADGADLSADEFSVEFEDGTITLKPSR